MNPIAPRGTVVKKKCGARLQPFQQENKTRIASKTTLRRIYIWKAEDAYGWRLQCSIQTCISTRERERERESTSSTVRR